MHTHRHRQLTIVGVGLVLLAALAACEDEDTAATADAPAPVTTATAPAPTTTPTIASAPKPTAPAPTAPTTLSTTPAPTGPQTVSFQAEATMVYDYSVAFVDDGFVPGPEEVYFRPVRVTCDPDCVLVMGAADWRVPSDIEIPVDTTGIQTEFDLITSCKLLDEVPQHVTGDLTITESTDLGGVSVPTRFSGTLTFSSTTTAASATSECVGSRTIVRFPTAGVPGNVAPPAPTTIPPSTTPAGPTTVPADLDPLPTGEATGVTAFFGVEDHDDEFCPYLEFAGGVRVAFDGIFETNGGSSDRARVQLVGGPLVESPSKVVVDIGGVFPDDGSYWWPGCKSDVTQVVVLGAIAPA